MQLTVPVILSMIFKASSCSLFCCCTNIISDVFDVPDPGFVDDNGCDCADGDSICSGDDGDGDVFSNNDDVGDADGCEWGGVDDDSDCHDDDDVR